MRGLRRLLLFLLVLLAIGVTVVLLVRGASGKQVGPPVAICPGPDEYGYQCTGEPLFEYVDASDDTMLHEDDSLVHLELPFSFTFYGAVYEEVWASSNGNLQFTGENADYLNVCLVPQPAESMGDMIAPYWDDLTLAFSGSLETELVGQAPERIFVIEWQDVPKFGTLEDAVTFEVQLFEGSNDIVFLYQDAQTLAGTNGSQATIGLQSERLGYALQASCNQIAVHDGSAIHFVHPGGPAGDDQEAVDRSPDADMGDGGPNVDSQPGPGTPALKGPAGKLVETLNRRGQTGLAGLRLTWLSQRPALASDWRWADLDGDGTEELVVLWRGDVTRPELVEIAVADPGRDGRWQLAWQTWPLARQNRLRQLVMADQGDVTGDGAEEIVLRDPQGGGLTVLMGSPDGFDLVDLPGRCGGSLLLHDANDDGVLEIILGGCPGGERWSILWEGQAFVVTNDQ